MLNGALVKDMVNNFSSESKKTWNFLIEKIEILVVKNISSLNFAKLSKLFRSTKEQECC